MSKGKRLVQLRAGRLVSAVLYTQALASDPEPVRAAKMKMSSAAKVRQNRRALWQKCEMLLAGNFDVGDLFVTLTYRDTQLPATREEALRCLNLFLRQLQAQRRARGEPLLYIKATEQLGEDGRPHRWHHHLAINGTGRDFEELRALWSRYGDDVDIQPLICDGESYTTRAQYLSKERPPAGKQTWTPSRNLRRPERSSELVDDALTLTAPPGAQILESYQEENGWGSFVYVKYLLPYRPRPASAPRRRTRHRE